MASATGSSPSPELAAALHRLRSTLARLKAELELALVDGVEPPVERLLGDLNEAFGELRGVEEAAFGIVSVLVVDDDARLAELTARGLRRLGYDAESAGGLRELRPGELVVFDLGLAPGLGERDRSALKAARPIVVTGATDPRSRALAASLGATDFLVKPIELEDLAAAISRRGGRRVGFPSGMSVAPIFEGWHRTQAQLIHRVSKLATPELQLSASADGWPIWAIVSHMAGARIYWLCGVLKEPGAETTPFPDPLGEGWEDRLDVPRRADELILAVESSWQIVESCLARWTPEMLSETFTRHRDGEVQRHTRQSVLTRLLMHDAFHCGEISNLLGGHGFASMDPWEPIS